jgi:hypothetical protein
MTTTSPRRPHFTHLRFVAAAAAAFALAAPSGAALAQCHPAASTAVQPQPAPQAVRPVIPLPQPTPQPAAQGEVMLAGRPISSYQPGEIAEVLLQQMKQREAAATVLHEQWKAQRAQQGYATP